MNLSVFNLETVHSGPLSMTVAAGETLFLSGPSGVGKSLLLRAIADLDPHQGEVRLGEWEQSGTPPTLWRQRVGYLPAESHWWEPTVAPHLPPSPQRESLLERLAFPLTALEWEVARLSSGERQRLALARLLLHEPRALLLDEPTANLDPASVTRVEQLVCEYQSQHQAPAVWVTHDPGQIQRLPGHHWRLEVTGLVAVS